MLWHKIFKYFVLKFFILFILGNSYTVFSSAGVDIETLKKDKETLRYIASVVFKREKGITYIPR
ncbi:hypothetical protein IM40_03930 [Candidatus Paracaedimonas acanthamoebae]|nr:hypothetical protein IM40_03930 [Candidatus Paracaedimonas acanthamoebae]